MQESYSLFRTEMNCTPRLSVCIPTFNRLSYLKEVLAILVPQAELAGVEICISDNHSTDGTSKFLQELATGGVVKYTTQAENIGIDGNMLAVITMATGQYIYPLGDDDMLPAGSLIEILQEIDKGGDVLVLNGWHTDPLLTPINRHLSDSIIGCWFEQPDQAFIALWDKMPFGSFLARREYFLKKNFDRFMGTSHAYTGAVWDALADKMEKKGSCMVRCMEAPTVLLRGAEKTWSENAAKIVLQEIPFWFDLIAEKNVYRKSALEIKSDYMKRQTSFLSLIRFLLVGQLEAFNVSMLSTACNKLQKVKMTLVAYIPVPIIKFLIYIRAGLSAKSIRKIQ